MPSDSDTAVSSRAGAWHQSTLQTIQDCPRRWFLTYQLGLPDPSGEAAQTGTAVHAAVEAHEVARKDGKSISMDDALDVMREALGPDASDDQLEVGRHALRHWWKTPLKDGGPSHREWLSEFEVVAIEPYFNLDLVDDALPIGGWVDGVYRDPATGLYQLVDLKTAKTMGRWKDSGEGKRHQATMYSVALLLGGIEGVEVDYLADMTYTVVKTGKGGECAKRVTVTPDLADVALLGQRIREAEATVVADEFPRNPSWNLCSEKWCPHYNGCMVTGELSGSPVTLRSVRNSMLPEAQ